MAPIVSQEPIDTTIAKQDELLLGAGVPGRSTLLRGCMSTLKTVWVGVAIGYCCLSFYQDFATAMKKTLFFSFKGVDTDITLFGKAVFAAGMYYALQLGDAALIAAYKRAHCVNVKECG